MTRAQHHPATKEYLARKEADGKTKKGALRALKRHLARRFHHLLSLPPLTPSDDHSPNEHTSSPAHQRNRDDVTTEILGVAPTPMMCVS